MWRFQVHSWPCGLLLSTSVILAIRLHCSEIPARSIMWSHLWLLSKIPLWVEFYQYWGAVITTTSDMDAMEKNVIVCLDAVPLFQIRRWVLLSYLFTCSLFCCRFANQSGQFISAYVQGLSGAETVWANHRYHGHQTLLPDMVWKAKSSQK